MATLILHYSKYSVKEISFGIGYRPICISVSAISVSLIYRFCPVNEERPEKSAEISKFLLQEWIPPTKIFKTAKIT